MRKISSGRVILKDEWWVQNTMLGLLLHLCQAERSVLPASEMCPDWSGFLTLSLSSLLAHNLEYKTARSVPLATSVSVWKLEKSDGCIHLQIRHKLSL